MSYWLRSCKEIKLNLEYNQDFVNLLSLVSCLQQETCITEVIFNNFGIENWKKKNWYDLCFFSVKLSFLAMINIGCMMIKDTSVLEISPCLQTFPLRAKWRWCERLNKPPRHTQMHKEYQIFNIRMIFCVFADRKCCLSINVHRGWRWPECFEHWERKPGRLFYFQHFASLILESIECVTLVRQEHTLLAVIYISLLLYPDVLMFQLLNHSFSGHQIEETLRAAGKSQLFTCLSYPGAGHLIEPPYSPNSRVSLWSVKPRKREL